MFILFLIGAVNSIMIALVAWSSAGSGLFQMVVFILSVVVAVCLIALTIFVYLKEMQAQKEVHAHKEMQAHKSY